MDNTELEADYQKYDRYAEQLGEDGLIIPLICPESKSSFQSMLEHWVGTEDIAYALMDYPELVVETLKAMERVSMEGARISAASDAPVFLSWEDTYN